jgi:hypothetical protein
LTGSKIIFVATAPLSQPAADLIAPAAHILNKDAYEIRLLLAAKTPRVAAGFPDLSSAKKACSDLEALGIGAFIIPEPDLYRPAEYFKANRIVFEVDGVRFEDRSGKSKTLRTVEVFLLLKGRLVKHFETEIKTTRRKLNITGTLLMGGIPVLKKETKTVKEASIETSIFLRIYTRESMDPEVELLQGDIDYSFLGPEMAATSAANFGLLIKKIRGKFPAAVFDDKLMEAGRPGLSSLTQVDISSIDSRLIYLNYVHYAGEKSA